jgi:hypothetical protein
VKTSTRSTIPAPNRHVNIIGLPSGLFPSGLPKRILYADIFLEGPLPSHLHLAIPADLSSLYFRTKIFVWVSHYVTGTAYPAHLMLIDLLPLLKCDAAFDGAQIMKLLIMQFSLSFSYLLHMCFL